jgi:multidrug resistance protein MdtO
VRSLADGVLLEFGPSRPHDLALRDRIRRWQPQVRALFIMRGASLKYRLQLPGFVLPQAVVVSLQAYDERSAQVLENIADRLEGKASQGTPVSADSLAPLEQVLESCRTDESQLLLSEHGATFVPLLREIDRLTSRLASEIAI